MITFVLLYNLMQRYFLHLSYKGSAYHGWQRQANTSNTIQQVLDENLSRVLNQPIEVTGCGRTDTGVHAKDFYAHFDADNEKLHLEKEKWIYKFNAVLPNDIVVHNVIPVPNDSNSRFDALSRTYHYVITNKKDPFLKGLAYYSHVQLDIEKMNKAANILFEYTDFSSFSKSQTQTFTNNCKIMQAEWKKEGDLLIFVIKADRFLRNMVRAIVGTLLLVGQNKMDLETFRAIVECKDRTKAGASAPAAGLFLVNVEYPESLINKEV